MEYKPATHSHFCRCGVCWWSRLERVPVYTPQRVAFSTQIHVIKCGSCGDLYMWEWDRREWTLVTGLKIPPGEVVQRFSRPTE